MPLGILMNNTTSPWHQAQRGFTLIEVLVAVLVLSIGLLGLAALQATSLRFNHSAYMRTQATILAQDIADSMRANRGSALDGEYDIDIGENAPTGTTRNMLDLQNWKTTLAAVLPNGDGSIALDSQMVTITVRWFDDRTAEPGDGDEGSREFLFRTQL
jgi:type IV pilus assembly protein PilV